MDIYDYYYCDMSLLIQLNLNFNSKVIKAWTFYANLIIAWKTYVNEIRND